jgi:RNA polymerase sigma factor (sigma-70 family)
MVDLNRSNRSNRAADEDVPLEVWLDEYLRQTFYRPSKIDGARRTTYLRVIAERWAELWANAAERGKAFPDNAQLAADIRNGNGAPCGERFSGDPLRLALLEHLIASDERFRPTLEHWFDGYWRELFGRSMAADDPRRPRYLQRMTAAWAHHWNTAIEQTGGRYVAGLGLGRRVRAGKGYVRGGSLGGDPLRDVVLAEAIVHGEPSARAIFEQENKGFILAQAIDVDNQIRTVMDDWWHEFSVWLYGDADPPGKFPQFRGKCGIRHWLATVARRFALAEVLQRNRTAAIEPSHEPAVDNEAYFAQLRLDIQQALDRLSVRHRCVVVMVYLEGHPQTEVALVLDVSEGHVSRIKKEALDKMRQYLSSHGYGNGKEQES